MTRQGYTPGAAPAATFATSLAVFVGLFTIPTWLPALVELGAQVGEAVSR